MNSKKQKLLIEYLLSSSDTFAMCQGIIQSDYFDPEFRNSVEFIFDYYDKYSSIPTPSQVDAETNVSLELYDILERDQVSYCADEIETFCKRRAIEQATLSLPALIEAEDYGAAETAIKEAVSVSLNRNLGVRYFESVEERLERMMHENLTQPTGWSELDEALFGGISRQELLLVSANSGGGKSITLANLALSFVEQGLNVLYISLELSADVVSQRFDTMITGVGRKVWRDHVSEITTRVTAAGQNSGIMDITQMPSGTSSHDIRAFLKEFNLHYGMMPDLLVVDYIDEMAPNEKVSADNVWEKDKRCASQLRQIAVDFNMYLATASQLNRSAVGIAAEDHDHSQIAGGISKINVSDVYWSIVMTDDMRVAGEIVFILLKTRNSDGVGKHFQLAWDNKHLRIRDRDQGLTLVKKQKTLGSSGDPVDKMDELFTM